MYPSSNFAYGLATRYPIERQPDALSGTDWKVKVKGPNIVVLEPHRKDTEKWDRPLDQLVSRSPRIWLIGSHFFPDWKVLKGKLLTRNYWPVRTYSRDRRGARPVRQSVVDRGCEPEPVARGKCLWARRRSMT